MSLSPFCLPNIYRCFPGCTPLPASSPPTVRSHTSPSWSVKQPQSPPLAREVLAVRARNRGARYTCHSAHARLVLDVRQLGGSVSAPTRLERGLPLQHEPLPAYVKVARNAPAPAPGARTRRVPAPARGVRTCRVPCAVHTSSIEHGLPPHRRSRYPCIVGSHTTCHIPCARRRSHRSPVCGAHIERGLPRSRSR
ncbi:hypothetical protein B0H11DRAFT_165468 [Mycena galericulata]|nr:hypothetical protein B0H11DRAFT_165468 [Mycena galericulata]